MLNDTVIKKIKRHCLDKRYDELVVALCNPAIYKLLDEVISIMMMTNVPEDYVNRVYFYHKGEHPLQHHPLLPELQMDSFSGQGVSAIYVSASKSMFKYTSIIRDVFIRYFFGDSLFKDTRGIKFATIAPFNAEEITPYIPFINANLNVMMFIELTSRGHFKLDAFERIIEKCYIKKLKFSESSEAMEKIFNTSALSEAEKEQYSDIIIRAHSKHKLIYGGL